MAGIELRPEDTPQLVEIAPIIEGKPDVTKVSEIKNESFREQVLENSVSFSRLQRMSTIRWLLLGR